MIWVVMLWCWRKLIIIDEESSCMEARHERFPCHAWSSTTASIKKTSMDNSFGFICQHFSHWCLCLSCKQLCLLLSLFFKRLQGVSSAATSSFEAFNRWWDRIRGCNKGNSQVTSCSDKDTQNCFHVFDSGFITFREALGKVLSCKPAFLLLFTNLCF